MSSLKLMLSHSHSELMLSHSQQWRTSPLAHSSGEGMILDINRKTSDESPH